MKGLVVTASTGLREELRGLSRVRSVKRCAAFRPVGHDEIAVTKTSMRMLARRIRSLEAEINEVDKALKVLVLEVAPQLVDEFGVGPVCAAQVYVSWSHPGRCRNEASFARLVGVAPIEATSGQTQNRHRLNRGGDRQLNRALHTIVTVRSRYDTDTRDCIARSLSRKRDQERRPAMPQALRRQPALPPPRKSTPKGP